MNTPFQFKQFSIVRNQCGMPVSTDGVLLGAWATAEENHNILDIGTGTGLLALMMAQRFLNARILALDIDNEAVRTARFNAEQSPWANRIKVENQDIRSWVNPSRFDTIICNPPYFDSGKQAHNKRRATSRHTENMSHEELLRALQKCLTREGKAHLILPSKQADTLINSAAQHSLFCHQITQVKTTPNKVVSRKLITLSPQRTSANKHKIIVIQENGKYTSDFIALTKDFYIKL